MATSQRKDGRLWWIALGLSLLLNGSLVVLFAFAALRSEKLDSIPKANSAAAPPPEEIVTIFPEFASPPPQPAAEKPRFARTSPDQVAPPPEKPAFMGERNTQATSDRAPDTTAPALPSQTGIAPRQDEVETTESDYQDGKMNEASAKPGETKPTPPAPALDPASPVSPPAGAKTETPGKDDSLASSPERTPLMQGPNPIDVPVPLEEAKIPDSSPTEPPKSPAPGKPETAETPPSPEPPKPASPVAPQDPTFKGNQRKTAILGSISRNGRSALDVADSPLGRYQAIISRAVEQEWQRNCVRHRDFITPGFLTVRFFVEPSGRVRTVQFVGEMETGEVQKGFTLNSIRNAGIPAMPPAVKKELAGEALELLFNFYF